MRTLIVSDLHFGSASGADVLRLPHVRQALLDALQDVDLLVLLGDVLELRHGPRRTALDSARPFLQELGERMAGGEIAILAGNHDHALVDGWLQRRAELSDSPPLRLEQRLAPEEASPMAATLAGWAAPAHVTIAYPGIWVRDDVYAMHGQYLDCHMTVPTIERIAIAAMGRMLKLPQDSLRQVADYEAVTSPIYAWVDAVAAQGSTRAVLNGSATMRMWRTLAEDGSGRRSWRRDLPRTLKRGAMRRGFPAAVSALNLAGLGPVKADISGPALRRAGLSAMGEVAARLGLGDAHVIFGHTHRAGPLPADEQAEWIGRLGARLHNCGSWVYSAGFLSPEPGESPYWPGCCIVVDGERPPELRRLLADHSHAELGGAPAVR